MGRHMDDYGPEDMALPEVKLVQNVGGEQAKQCKAKPGDFFLSLNDEVIPGQEGLDIVVVDIVKTRTYWGRTEIEDEPPECTSRDAHSGFSDDGKRCSECEFCNDAPWLINADERKKVCTVDYNVMGIRLSDHMPMIIRAGGISALGAKELITQLKLNREIKGAYHRAKIHISSLPKKTAAGDAFAIRFKLAELIPDEEAKELETQSNRLLGEPEPVAELTEPKPPMIWTKDASIIGFMPDGKTPFRSEEERQKLVAAEQEAKLTEPVADIPEPIGFMPDGTAFYSEEEKQRIIAAEEMEEAKAAKTTPIIQQEIAAEKKLAEEAAKTLATKVAEPEPEPKKEPEPEKPIDYDF